MQAVFKEMGYASWQGLSFAETKAKAAPFRETIKETWARLKRAHPEMQSAAQPFVKKKWGEREYFIVQVRGWLRVEGGVDSGYGSGSGYACTNLK